MNNIAVITNVFDENVLLPLWLRYYGGQFGYQNLFIIDDGSTDGSTKGLSPVHVISRPKTVIDQFTRAATASALVRLLLEHYEIVLFTDVDEFLVTDPLLNRDLATYLPQLGVPHMNGLGLNVLHDRRAEADYTPDLPVLQQRKWVQFERSYCKQTAHREPALYRPGFHVTNFDRVMIPGLYLFHLRAFDYRTSEQRISHRNQLAWSERSLKFGHGQQNRMSTAQYLDTYYGAGLEQTLAGAAPSAKFGQFVVEKLQSLKRPEKTGLLVKRGDAIGLPERFGERIPAATAPLTATEQERQSIDPQASRIDADALYEEALSWGLSAIRTLE